MSTADRTCPLPPIRCTPCRVTLDGQRYRVYPDGSVSPALSWAETQKMGFATVKEVLLYESSTLTRFDPRSPEAAAVRKEASRQRRNRNARDRAQALRDLGLKCSPATPGGWE